jgi:2',3'-cyclic-nucleotide 2'-phosphodiesterase (5'-nucleotidase family)
MVEEFSMQLRRLLAGVLILSSVLVLQPLPVGAADAPVTEITLIHDTHVHGNLDTGTTNIAQKAFVVNEIRGRKPGALFVGNGDDLHTSLLSTTFQGKQIVDAFNTMGLVVDGVGNHEFDLGPEVFVARVQESNFPWVTANLRDKRTGDAFGAEAGVRTFTIKEVNGVKIGFTSLAPIDTLTASTPGPNMQVLGYADAIREVMPKMKEAGAQVIVLLSHICGGPAEALAAEVPGIDAIVGDHCAEVLEQPKMVGNTIISRVGDEYHNVGELTLKVQNGKVVDHTFTLHPLTEKSPAEPTMTALIKKYQSDLEVGLAQVIGKTETPLDSMKATNRFRETGLGNFISDVTRLALGADVAITNGGNIRADKVFQPGPVTKKMVVQSLPFPNTLMKLEVSGVTLLAALENGVSQVDQGAGRFPQVSGVAFRVDPTRPAGQRVSAVQVAGKPLDPNATYTLAVNSFLAGGGDGYEMLKDMKVITSANTGPLVATSVIDAITKMGTIAPRPEGRILYTTGVQLEVGKQELVIAGRKQPIDVAPEVKDGLLYSPVRWVAELYGIKVDWDMYTRTANFTLANGQIVAIQTGKDGYINNGRMMVSPATLAQFGIKAEVQGTVLNLGL